MLELFDILGFGGEDGEVYIPVEADDGFGDIGLLAADGSKGKVKIGTVKVRWNSANGITGSGWKIRSLGQTDWYDPLSKENTNKNLKNLLVGHQKRLDYVSDNYPNCVKTV